MKKAVLFDLDGTLICSDRFLFPAYRQARETMGLPPLPEEQLKLNIGGTFAESKQIAMPDSSDEAYFTYVKLVQDLVHSTFFDLVAHYPAIPEMLDRLHGLGYQIALCSNGSSRYFMPLLEKTDLLRRIDCIPPFIRDRSKTDLLAAILQEMQVEPKHAAMVGDRVYDAEAARNNGVCFIGCHYGLFPEEIEANRPDITIDHPDKLVDAVEKLLGGR